ncbi:TerD family protein [Streptomyces sp. NPDC001633]|uniref:TerD family protein n=1 Tax=Streptomyces sp. NPDC001633 TaxID=3364595 RepID=UPI003694BD15
MTAELVRGQNHPLDRSRVEIRIAAGVPVVAGVTLGDEQGGLPDADAVVHPGAPRRPGVEVPGRAAAEHRITVDLDALPATVHRVGVLLALAAGSGAPATFGAAPAPSVRLTPVDGTGLAGYTLTGLTAETAVVAVELYRRQGAWKVRAVGQGYADGLAALLHDQGLARAAELAAEIEAAAAPDPTREAPVREAPAPVATSAAATPPATGPVDYRHPGRRSTPTPPATAPAADGPPPPVAGDAAGWSMEERLYNQIWGMFEDLARSVAAYRSASDFAASRLAQELDEVLADPRNRLGTAADVARATARDRHATLLTRARAALDRDLAQLTAESEVVEPALPPAFARWDNPVWQGHHVPLERPMALRLGDLHLPEVLDLRIPMLVRLPLERGLWIDSGPDSLARGAEPGPEREFGRRELGSALTDGPPDAAEVRRLALEAAVAIAARLLAVHPAGEFAVQVIDPGGAAGQALAPLVETGALPGPPVPGAQGVATVLEGLIRRVDLVQMAVRSRAADALPPDLDTAEQLLIVHDFPHGFDDRAVTMLRYLADEGPAAGVHLMMVADRAQAREFGPVLDPLWRSLLRITPVPDAHLADPWVGHAWTYEPALAPKGSQVVRQVLTRLAEARRAAARTEPAGPALPPTP